MIAFGVLVTTRVSNNQYDLVVNGQGRIPLNQFYGLNSELSLSVFQRVFIFGKMIAYDMNMTTKVSDRQYDLRVTGPGQIYRERSGSVVECLTRDRRAAGSSLTGAMRCAP